jgi:hypothetical protein
MTTTVPLETKAPTVKVELTVTFEGKSNMSISDMNALTESIKPLITEAAKLGTPTGTVTIGKQKFRIEG